MPVNHSQTHRQANTRGPGLKVGGSQAIGLDGGDGLRRGLRPGLEGRAKWPWYHDGAWDMPRVTVGGCQPPAADGTDREPPGCEY